MKKHKIWIFQQPKHIQDKLHRTDSRSNNINTRFILNVSKTQQKGSRMHFAASFFMSKHMNIHSYECVKNALYVVCAYEQILLM